MRRLLPRLLWIQYWVTDGTKLPVTEKALHLNCERFNESTVIKIVRTSLASRCAGIHGGAETVVIETDRNELAYTSLENFSRC